MAGEAELDDFVAFLRGVEGLAVKTAANYRGYVAGFLAWLAAVEPESVPTAVSARDLQRFLVAEQVRGLAPRTRASQRDGLRAFHRYLVAAGLRSDDPTADLPAPRRPPGRIDHYRPEEAVAILAHTGGLADLLGRQRHAAVAVLRWAGLRSGELRELRLEHVDLPARRIEVVGKGNRWRVVPLPRPLAAVLDRHLAVVRPQLPASGFVFANPDPRTPDPHHRLSKQRLEREVELAGVGAGVAGRHFPHKWRHTFATELVRSGVDLALVQRLLGHRSIASTVAYTHLADDDLRSALDGVYG